MNQQKSQTLKGFRDFLPQEIAVRNYVKKIVIEVFEKFGFLPLETPTLEYASTLMGKYGKEADKLVYSFKDKGDRQIGLRYDLTVPTAKVLSIYQNKIQYPFKRYQIQPVWRADKPQKGRYREFLQCDVDTFGPLSPINDAEIINVIYNILEKLNFKKYSIRVNSRAVLSQILAQSGIKNNQNSVLQSLDKFQKIGEDRVKDELKSKSLPQSQIDQLFKYIKTAQPDDYLKQVFDKVKNLGIPEKALIFDPTMVRGLDYYTGPIFETYVEKPLIGSVTGGGRYDNLVSLLGGPDIPAVGTTIGLDRIVDVIQELNLLPDLKISPTKILITNFGQETEANILKLASQLRDQNISTLVYPTPDKLSRQIKYALNLGIPYLAIIGTDEAKNNLITLKNLKTKQQETVNIKQLYDRIT